MKFIGEYLDWHYFQVWPKLLVLWRNLTLFPIFYFSVFLHLRTLFAPWKRLQENAINPLKDFQGFLANVFVNIIMRIVGFVVRVALIALALIGFLFVTAVGLVLISLWLFMPFLLAHVLVVSIGLLFS